MKSLATFLFALLVVPSAIHAADKKRSVKIHGYITAINSAHSFEIDDYKIMSDATVNLEFDTEDDDDEDNKGKKSGLPMLDQLRIGQELEIKGDYDPETSELKAKSIKVYTIETRKIKRTALMELEPSLIRKPNGWEGTLTVDGQKIVVDEKSQLTILPNNTQKKAAKSAAKAKQKDAPAEREEPVGAALLSLGEIHAGMFASYEGTRLADGSIWAKKVTFKDNEFTKAESQLWRQVMPRVKNLTGAKPPELLVGKNIKLKLVSDRESQAYIARLANSLVPDFQRRLPSGSPNRIPFQFHLAQAKEPNAFCTPNGVVVVQEPMLAALENEAQLAFIIGHEIAHATQEHSLRQMEFHKKKRMALQLGAAFAAAYGAYNLRDLLNIVSTSISSGYQRYLENQADRMGLEYMVHAGFDPREAPQAWRALSRKHGDSRASFWSSHDSNTTRRSYLMAEIQANYSKLDFANFKRDSEEFQRIRGSVGQRSSPGKLVKVKKNAKP